MQPVGAVVYRGNSLEEIKNIFEKKSVEFLPVVDEKNKLVGFIERKVFNRAVSTRFLELERSKKI